MIVMLSFNHNSSYSNRRHGKFWWKNISKNKRCSKVLLRPCDVWKAISGKRENPASERGISSRPWGLGSFLGPKGAVGESIHQNSKRPLEKNEVWDLVVVIFILPFCFFYSISAWNRFFLRLLFSSSGPFSLSSYVHLVLRYRAIRRTFVISPPVLQLTPTKLVFRVQEAAPWRRDASWISPSCW